MYYFLGSKDTFCVEIEILNFTPYLIGVGVIGVFDEFNFHFVSISFAIKIFKLPVQ